MRSLSLLIYNRVTKKIDELARDFNTNFMTSCSFITDAHYLGTDKDSNLFTVRRFTEATSDEERLKLEPDGYFHLGDMINVIRDGTLVMESNDDSHDVVDDKFETSLSTDMQLDDNLSNLLSLIGLKTNQLMGSIHGGVYAMATLTASQYKILELIQDQLKTIDTFGGLSFTKWRTFTNFYKKVECKNFIDGDLIETFLNLSIVRVSIKVSDVDV